MARLKVPAYAKKAASEALKKRRELPSSKKFGLSAQEAKEKGIESGVSRARQIIQKDYYDWKDPEDREDLKQMSAFYSRFQNCYSKKCEGSMGLWGGRWFLRNKVRPFVDKMRGRY